jgi:MFS transporter, DHA1 family, multidrug resistance protein
MGIQWAGLMLGLVAFAAVPVPVIFYLRGAKIREKSSFAPTFPMVNKANAENVESDEEKNQ